MFLLSGFVRGDESALLVFVLFCLGGEGVGERQKGVDLEGMGRVC